MEKTVLTETWQPEGFVLKVERVETPDWGFTAITDDEETHEAIADMKGALENAPAFMEVEAAYTLADEYIGNPDAARTICGMGIKPELRSPDHNVCSIGFCEAEQKWYGWSHRAIFGFGIGSTVKKGDCGYVPVDMEDACADAVNFWQDDGHLNTTARPSVDADGRACIAIEWTYADTIPNKKLHGEKGGAVTYPPEPFGRGEWTAETLDDARQMACDFAEGVS